MARKSKRQKELDEIKKNLEHDVQVPLLVKKSKNNRRMVSFNGEDVKDELKKQDSVSNNKISNAILICFIVLLLFITSYVIVGRIVESNKSSVMVSKSDDKKKKKVSIINNWVTLDNNMFMFTADDTFYWYDDSTSLKDNYYSGNFEYKNGKEALKEMGYEEDDFLKIFGEKIDIDRVFSLQLKPREAFIEGKDQTSTYLPENTSWWMIVVIKSDGSAIAYNKTLDKKYHMSIKV